MSSVVGTGTTTWLFKVVPVAHGYDVYAHSPILAFYGHATTVEEADAMADRQPTPEESVRMLLASS